MMEETEYRPNTELWQYKTDSIVKNVPVNYFNNDKDTQAYREKMKNFRPWKERVEKFTREFDPQKFEPLFYCQKCRRMEDGGHRLEAAKRRAMKTLDVRIGRICYKRCVSVGLLPGNSTELINIFYETIKKHPISHNRDMDWLNACAKKKWPLFNNLVDFRYKSFLDVGCHVGYSCIEAWSRQASYVMGIDTREDVLIVAESIKKALKIGEVISFHEFHNKMKFQRGDWTEIDMGDQKFDIVMIMGLLHYFPKAIYLGVLRKLCFVCKETLIIELRIIEDDHPRLIDIGGQTLPTIGWLENALKSFGFNPHKKIMREEKRALWIAKR